MPQPSATETSWCWALRLLLLVTYVLEIAEANTKDHLELVVSEVDVEGRQSDQMGEEFQDVDGDLWLRDDLRHFLHNVLKMLRR